MTRTVETVRTQGISRIADSKHCKSCASPEDCALTPTHCHFASPIFFTSFRLGSLVMKNQVWMAAGFLLSLVSISSIVMPFSPAFSSTSKTDTVSLPRLARLALGAGFAAFPLASTLALGGCDWAGKTTRQVGQWLSEAIAIILAVKEGRLFIHPSTNNLLATTDLSCGEHAEDSTCRRTPQTR
jgi:hypothetical protein